MGLEVNFCWVPAAHVGVKGNEMIADEWAKKATNKADIDIKVKYSKAEMKCLIKQHVRNRWQKQWEERTGIWFYNIQRIVDKGKTNREKLKRRNNHFKN